MTGIIPPFRRRRRSSTPPQPPDAHAWAAKIRAEMGWAGCGNPEHLYDSEFRRDEGLRPVDECVLRDLARRQIGDVIPPPGLAVSPEAARLAEAWLNAHVEAPPPPPDPQQPPLPRWTQLPDDPPGLREWLIRKEQQEEGTDQ